MDFVSFECPEGFVFRDTNDYTQYAFCQDTSYAYDFESTEDPCVRECKNFFFCCVVQYLRLDSAIECPPAPYFQPNSTEGTWDYNTTANIRTYKHEIVYECPIG